MDNLKNIPRQSGEQGNISDPEKPGRRHRGQRRR